MKTTQEVLAGHGVTMAQAHAYIAENLHQPDVVVDAAAALGLSVGMLAEIAAVSNDIALGFLEERHLDWRALNAHSTRPTDYVFLTDMQDGSVFLHNALTGGTKMLHSFGRTVTDIAVDPSGKIYVCDFWKILEYDPSTGATRTVVSGLQQGVNSLTIQDGVLLAAGAADSALVAYDAETGAQLWTRTLGGGNSAGDIAFVDDALFRTSETGGLVKHAADGSVAGRIADLDETWWGLTATPGGQLRAFSSSGAVTQVDPQTGLTTALPPVQLAGLLVSGAAEAMELHLAAFL